MLHHPFALFCRARAWSRPVSRWQHPALARQRAPVAPWQLWGHSRCRGTAQGANLETVPAKAERELLGLCYLPGKKKKTKPQQNRMSLPAYISDLWSKLCKVKYPVFMLLSKESLEFGLFRRGQKKVRPGHSLHLEPKKCSPGLPHKNLLCRFPTQPFTCHHSECKKIQHFFSAQLSRAKWLAC